MGNTIPRCYPIPVKPAAKDLLCVGLLLTLVAAVFPLPAFSPSNLLATRFSDVITQYLPHQLFVRHTVFRHHRFPFWNPYECAGTPAFPNPLYPALSFPAVLLLPLPPPLAVNLGFFMHLFMAGALTFACARQAGCSRAASLFAGIIYALGARSLTHIQAGLYSRMIFFAYIPLIFLCAERCLGKPSIRSAAWFAISLSLALLTGELQLLIYALVCSAAYAVLRSWITPSGMTGSISPRRSWACFLSGAILCIPLSAFYLLPSQRLYPLLSRSSALGPGRLDFMPSLREVAASLCSPGLIGEFSPFGTLPWECALFMGLAPIMLIARCALDRESRRDLMPWGLLAAAAVLLSIKELAPLHAALARLAPSLGQFRNPGRMLYLASFFSAVLAARAFDAAVAGRKPAFLWLPILAGGMLVYGLLLARVHGASCGGLARNYAHRFEAFFGAAQLGTLDMRHLELGASLFKLDAIRSLLFSLLLIPPLCLVCALGGRGRIRPGLVAFALSSTAFLDLFRASPAFLEVHPLGEIYPPSPLVAAIRDERGGGRLLDATPPPRAAFWTAFPFYRSTAIGISRVDGYTPVNFTAYARYLDLMSGVPGPLPRWSLGASSVRAPGLLSLLGAGLVLSASPLDLPGLVPIGAFVDVPVYRQFMGGEIEPRLFLFRNRDRLPRAWLVPRVEICPPEREERELTRLDPYAMALVERGALPLSGGEPFRPVPITRYAPGLVEIEVRTDRAAYLCTREIWAPGWTASDTGKPVAVVRTNGIFCGVYLPPGRHEVRVRYLPPGFRIGVAVSLLTCAGLALLVCRGGGFNRICRSRF